MRLFDNVLDSVLGALVAKLDPARWTVAPEVLRQGEECSLAYGPMLGRRLIDYSGVICVLALREDGSFRPKFVPASTVPDTHLEDTVRGAFCRRAGRITTSHPHKFTSSPVYPLFCKECGLCAVEHERMKLSAFVEGVLAPNRVVINWMEGISTISCVHVREPKQEPVVAFGSDAKPLPTPPANPSRWRRITQKEIDRLRVEGIDVSNIRVLEPDTDIKQELA